MTTPAFSLSSVRRVAAAFALVTGAALLPSAATLNAKAQSVAPVISEYHGGSAAGSFDLSNDSLVPLVVTIEPMSFSIDREGKGEFRKLDATIQVTFSETSLRLPPQSKRTVYYKASSETYPAWFSVYAAFHGMPKQNGVNVQLQLPHTVYLLGNEKKAKAAKGDLALEDLHVEGDVLKGTVHNQSAKMLRVDDVDVSAGHAKETIGGFPLLPGGLHDFEVRLEKKNVASGNVVVASVEPPARVVAHYNTLSVEAVIADKGR